MNSLGGVIDGTVGNVSMPSQPFSVRFTNAFEVVPEQLILTDDKQTFSVRVFADEPLELGLLEVGNGFRASIDEILCQDNFTDLKITVSKVKNESSGKDFFGRTSFIDIKLLEKKLPIRLELIGWDNVWSKL